MSMPLFMVVWSVWAAITKYHRPGGFLSHSSGGWKSEIKVLADSVSGEDLLPGS